MVKHHRVTRRDFLRSAVFAALANMAPVLPRCVPETGESQQQRLLDGWEFFHGSLGGPWDAWRGDKAGSGSWRAVEMPHCFTARDCVDPDAEYYQGPAWYRTRLQIKNPFPGGRTLLRFEGAGQKTDVFVYLEKMLHHSGGYDEFVVDITDAAARALSVSLNRGEVPIAVLCDNSRDLEMIPSSLNDFTRHGGLYRYVNLVYVPAISLAAVHLEPSVVPGKAARVIVKARLHNPQERQETLDLAVRLFDSGGSLISASARSILAWNGETVVASEEIKLPQLWSPAHPHLYRCEVSLTGQHGTVNVSERFGFRYFEFQTHDFFKLNGERLFLRGTQRVEDHALVGAAISDEVVSREFHLIKEMGANFVKLGHYQQSRTALNLCDELGLLVWEEIPWSRGGLGGAGYRQQAREMLAAMIDQHYNHPAIIVWGLGNENDWPGDFPDFKKEEIRDFVGQLNDDAHRLDPSRKTGLRRCEFCKEKVDVYSPSIWAGWYGNKYTDYRKLTESAVVGVDHFIHLEWGGDSHARRHSEDIDRVLSRALANHAGPADADLASGQSRSSVEGDWSETYICNLFDWYLKEQETMPHLSGAAQWAFKDFSSPVRGTNPVPHVNQKGLVERDLTPKEGYYVFQSYWSGKPMVHIYGHTWRTRWGAGEEKKLVKVYSNCGTVELFLNGISCGLRERNSRDFPAAGLHWMVQFKAGENHLRAVGQKNSGTVVDEVKFDYQTMRWGEPSRFRISAIDEAQGRSVIEAVLVDAASVRCLDARHRVRFGITGEGTLLDNVGTSRGARVVELYNGRAEIAVLTNGGKSVISIAAKNIPTAFLEIG